MKKEMPMSNQVLHVSSETIEEMERFYKDYLSSKLPPGSVFVARLPQCVITAYRSGKVLFQGTLGDKEAKRWDETITIERTDASATDAFYHRSFIGSDEVGTGDYFGPITVVASYVKKEQIPILQQIGVKDSKHLTDDHIVQIAKKLISIVPYSLLILSNEKYNTLQQRGYPQTKMKAILHNQAIVHLLKKIAPEQPEGILIDQFIEQDKYYSYVKGQKEVVTTNVHFRMKAEQLHLSVAASSIIARYAFLKEMHRLSEKAGFSLPKGAGKQVDEAAARLLREQGEEALRMYCKLHFANTEKAKRLVK
jgi:ribonuclease HIII